MDRIAVLPPSVIESSPVIAPLGSGASTVDAPPSARGVQAARAEERDAGGILPPPPLPRGRLLLRTLGVAEVHVGGVGVVGPAAERMFSLLVLGAMTPDHALSRDDVLGLVWPDTDREGARHSLRQHLYKLRGWGVPIQATRATVTLSRACLVPCFALDRTAALFDRDVLRGGEPFGHLFAGWTPTLPAMRRWVEDQRDRFQMDVRRILIPELRRLRDRADWLECERWARTVLEFDPYNEDGMLVLAEAIAMQGSRHSAHMLLDGYVRETGMAGTDLAQDLEAAQRRIGRATRVRHEAAATPTLVGRDEELRQLDAITLAALQGQTQVVHITGPAGIGKTELAYEATRRAVILGFTRCIVRVTRAMGQMPLGMLSRLVRDLLRLPGALGCRPESISALSALAGAEGSEATPTQAHLRRSYHAIRELLLELLTSVAFEQPLLILTDDIGDSDADSREILYEVLQLARGHSVLLIATHRTANVVDETQSILFHILELGPLSFDAATALAELIASPTGRRLSRHDAEIAAAACDRVPLSLITTVREKLVAGLTSSHPRSLTTMLADQIHRLPWQSQVLLQAMAAMQGRIAVTELNHFLGLSLADLQRAVGSLLESGHATQASDLSLGCHAEVSQAALSLLADSQLALLKQSLCTSLDKLMSEKCDTERLFELLALAEQCGSPSLLVQMTLKWSKQLEKSTPPHTYLRILDTALRYAQAHEERELLLRMQLIASREAAEWRVAATISQQLETIRTSCGNVAERLATIETSLHASLSRTATHMGTEALAIAKNASIPIDKRVHACRLALTAASECFNPQCAADAFRILQLIDNETNDAGIALTEARMQYDTIFGDLTNAVYEANAINRARVQLAQTPEGLRRLLNSSFTLRIAGQFTAARRCLDACFQSSAIEGSSSRHLEIIWRACVIAIDANQRNAAISLGEKLIGTARNLACWDEEWIQLFCLRLEELKTGSIKDCRIAEVHTAEIGETPTRAQLYCLALMLHWRRLRSDKVLLRRYVDEAQEYLSRFGRFTGMDFLAASTAKGLIALGDDSRARSVLHQYLSTDRRERGRAGFVFSGLAPIFGAVNKDSANAGLNLAQREDFRVSAET